MSFLSKAIGGGGGNVLSGNIGSILGGPLGAIGGMFGGSLFPGAPQVPGVNIPQYDPSVINNLIGQNQQSIQQTQGAIDPMFQKLYGQTSDLYGQQQKDLEGVLNTERSNAMGDLTTGTQGEAFREYYNKLGLLDSGAFNQGLANQFGQLQQNEDQQLMQQGLNKYGALQGILGQQTGQDVNLQNQGLQDTMGLREAGIQRQFGLQDESTQAAINSAIANAQLKQQYRQGNMQFAGQLLGGGMSLLGGGFG